MTDYKDVLRQIDRLDAMIPSGLLPGTWDFKALWQQIRTTGAGFKGVRFPTRQQHDESWSRFQDLVQRVKTEQGKKRSIFEKRRQASEELRKRLIRDVLPDSSGLADVILTLATGGLIIVVEQTLDALLGPFDKRKDELLQASRALKNAWSDFGARKSELLKDDKNTVYHALKNQQDRLDDLWAEYKAERQKACEAFHQERRQRHEEWRERTLSNVQKNQERQSHLEGVLDHKRNHLDSLHDRLSDARSDNYRSKVEGWISEEQAAIRDIERKIDEIKRWVSADLAKLND